MEFLFGTLTEYRQEHILKIAVALSGGVDSSVAAYLLKQAGHELVGVMMIIWETSRCCSVSAIEDARNVAKFLDIPFKTYNLIDDFRKEIVQPFCEFYINAKTPNPCPICNSLFKFGRLFDIVKEDYGVEKIATGHYAKAFFNESLKRYQLSKGDDPSKEQSYMLYSLNQDQLAHTVFPLGEMVKTQTKEIAFKLGLKEIANKKESQDVCFNEGDTGLFLESQLKGRIKKGYIVNTKGEVLGEHKGIVHYTIGQRKGLGLSHSEPLYVIKIIPENNTVVVGSQDETYNTEFIISDFNWVSIPAIKEPLNVNAKIRYATPSAPAIAIPLSDNKLKIQFIKPQKAITPGQVGALYDGNLLLGGGIIELP